MFARTPRLLLRPGWKEDAPALAAAIGDQAVIERLARAPSPYSLADAEAFLGREQGMLPDLLIFARTHGAPRLVGGVGLYQSASDIELGYWIARPYWGLGFATEAGRAVIDIADRGLRLARLAASHFVDNCASSRVLAKLGFVRSGEVRGDACRTGGSAERSFRYVRRAGALGRGSMIETGYDREDAMAA